MCRDALLGFLQIAPSQIRAGLEVCLVDLVEKYVAPRNCLGVEQFIPALVLRQNSRQSADADRVSRISLVAVALRVERRIDELPRPENRCARHAELLLDVA